MGKKIRRFTRASHAAFSVHLNGVGAVQGVTWWRFTIHSTVVAHAVFTLVLLPAFAVLIDFSLDGTVLGLLHSLGLCWDSNKKFIFSSV